MNLKRPFRADHVGSLLRPEQLKEARRNFEAGTINRAQLTQVEDAAIIDAINRQKEVGLTTITDGEFRRRWWHLDFIAGLAGITIYDFETEAFGIKSTMQASYVSGPLAFTDDHPFLDHFRFTYSHVGDGAIAKQTIPGPNMIFLGSYLNSDRYRDNPVYADDNAFINDLITTYRDIIQGFYDAGCRYLQLDDTSWGSLFDDAFRQRLSDRGVDPDSLITQFGDITEAILADKPSDLTITLHICKGNFQSRWLYDGSYDRIADRLLAINAIDGFFLEFDDERSGSFESLKSIGDQRIVLGLITSKTAELEPKEGIIKRIREAQKTVPLDQLCLSPQCGFASTEEGNRLTEEDQWRKLKHVVEIAKEVWG